MICPLKIKKAKILIKVPKNLFVIKTTITANITQRISYYLITADHCTQDTMVQTLRYIITLSKDTYTLISRVMSLGYEGGRYVLTQLGWNF